MNIKAPEIVTITGLSHDGRGIARLEGKTVFVENALVGEKVAIAYTKRKGRFDEARIVELLEAASGRQSPACDFFDICGGCSLQHMDSATQIKHKESVLLEQLLHIGGVTPKKVLPPVMAANQGYRRKARIGVRYVNKKEKLLIGFREKNGRYLADIDACAVLDPSIGLNIPLLRTFLLELEGFLEIPQLEIAVGDHHTAIIIRHLAALSDADLTKIKHFAEQNNFHIYLQPGGADTVQLFYPQNQAPRLSYKIDENIEMLFHPTDFTQVHAGINQQLIDLAMSLLSPKPHETILDLFCGIGNFTLPLAKRSKHVVGVEGSNEMVARGYENAKHNQITNVTFKCQNLADSDYTDNWIQQKYDAILIDPPRAGAIEVIEKLAKCQAKRIVYISCNPATLARDAGYLVKHGFELATVAVLDMFPHTSHVESIALFNKNE